MRQHIEKFSSMKDVTAPPPASAHSDIDLSSERPMLKLDSEANVRYASAVQLKQAPPESSPLASVSEKRASAAAAAGRERGSSKTDGGNDDDGEEEEVTAFDEDKVSVQTYNVHLYKRCVKRKYYSPRLSRSFSFQFSESLAKEQRPPPLTATTVTPAITNAKSLNVDASAGSVTTTNSSAATTNASVAAAASPVAVATVSPTVRRTSVSCFWINKRILQTHSKRNELMSMCFLLIYCSFQTPQASALDLRPLSRLHPTKFLEEHPDADYNTDNNNFDDERKRRGSNSSSEYENEGISGKFFNNTVKSKSSGDSKPAAALSAPEGTPSSSSTATPTATVVAPSLRGGTKSNIKSEILSSSTSSTTATTSQSTLVSATYSSSTNGSSETFKKVAALKGGGGDSDSDEEDVTVAAAPSAPSKAPLAEASKPATVVRKLIVCLANAFSFVNLMSFSLVISDTTTGCDQQNPAVGATATGAAVKPGREGGAHQRGQVYAGQQWGDCQCRNYSGSRSSSCSPAGSCEC